MTSPPILHMRAPAKINLFLHVTGRRADGYHLLQSAFELIDWADDIDIALLGTGAIERDGDLLGPVDDDLAVRAARALQALPQWRAQGSPGARLTIRKSIPAGAGLGGGSSDAATTLIGLNRLWNLELGNGELSALGLGLGADVPFFLFGRPAFAQGIGEDLQALPSMPRWLVVVVPACTVPTAVIFQAPELTRDSKALKIADFARLASEPVWEFGRNDLEPVTKARFPDVGRVLELLEKAAAGEHIASGAVRMSGSGGAVFCTTPDQACAERIRDHLLSHQAGEPGWPAAHVRVCRTLPGHPELASQGVR